MSPTQLFEPTYTGIKRRLMQGAWLPGSRIEVSGLAIELGVSMTPVRDSLNRLVGENMIDASTGAGFRMPTFSEQGLIDLFRFNAVMLKQAVALAGREWDVTHDAASDYADSCAQIFGHIAKRSANGEIIRVINNFNERLHWLRTLEIAIFDDVEDELTNIRDGLRPSALPEHLEISIEAYHARRINGCARFTHAIAKVKNAKA